MKYLKATPGLFLLLFLGITFLLITGCSNVDTDPPQSPHEGSLTPPGNVSVSRDSDNLHVTWSVVDGAEKYKIYRKLGEGAFSEVPDAEVAETYWIDADYPKDKTIRYAVKSGASGEYSSLSDPSNPIAIWAQNLKATTFGFKDKIKLTWDPHPEIPDRYIIYRYPFKSFDNDDYVPLYEIGETDKNYYEDNSNGTDLPYKNTPYFYRILWEKTGVVHGHGGPFALGIFSSNEVDVNEPNDHYLSSKELVVDGEATTSIVSSFGDGVGGVVEDVDWFKYHGPVDCSIFVSIGLPTDTGFQYGELHFQFYYDGVYGEDNLLVEDYIYNFDKFGAATGDVDLYFRVYPTVDSSKNVFGTYTIGISYEL